MSNVPDEVIAAFSAGIRKQNSGTVLLQTEAELTEKILSALEAAGLAVVPVQATNAMMDAGIDAARRELPPLEQKPPGFVQMRAAWSAMLTASRKEKPDV